MKRELIVMAKAPLIGYAKSRLIEAPGPGRLDAARVARLADAFIRDTLLVAERCAHEALSIVFAPPDSEPYFRALAPHASLAPQAEGDLGARLAAAVALAFDGGATRVVVIGTDCPHLPHERIDEAFDALEAADCVLGPARDGGYYLIGLKAPRPQLFRGIAWGTASVLAETVSAARAASLRSAQLAEERDIDEHADLVWLVEQLRTSRVRCPHTAAILEQTAHPDNPH